MTDIGENREPFAVCAPGMRTLVELALALQGEQAMEVRERSWLEGLDGAYIVTPPDFSAFTPPLVFAPAPPPSSVRWAREFAMTFIQQPIPFVLSSVI